MSITDKAHFIPLVISGGILTYTNKLCVYKGNLVTAVYFYIL